MDQRITINIAGKPFELRAESEEKERLMRLAAEDVKAVYKDYQQRFVKTDSDSLLSFSALQQAMSKVTFRDHLERLTAEVRSLESMLASYLSVEEEKSR